MSIITNRQANNRQVDNQKADNRRADNAALIFINENEQVLIVRDSDNGEWMTPGGHINGNETEFEAALREFREETSFSIKPEYFIGPIISDLRLHKNKKTTRIYIIHSNQLFPKYNQKQVINNETDALYYINLTDLKGIVNETLNHTFITKIKKYNKSSFRDLFINNLI